MLKTILSRKVIVLSAGLFTLLLIYMMPKDINYTINEIPQELEYVNTKVLTNSIFLVDNNNMLALTNVVVGNQEIESLVTDLINILIKGGVGENNNPSGFQSILPSDTKILSVKYENELLKNDFSKDLESFIK